MTLPRIDDLTEAMNWLQAGAPAGSKVYPDPHKYVLTLLRLTYELPVYFDVYKYGHADSKAQRALEVDPDAPGPSP
jgi:hypothetical protein